MTNDHIAPWTDIHSRVHQTIKQQSLLKSQDRLLIAVSGGQDSLCLLKLLWDLQAQWQWEMAIAHCDHRWSCDQGIADHVAHIAQQLELPFYLKTAPPMKETEAQARAWRYQALMDIAQEQQFSTIITGHTQSDRAETFLYNLMRGSGADGLQALTWKRPLTGELFLVRPLLTVSRSETFQFCQQFKLPIWEDQANHNPQYTRNRIRSRLIPYLQLEFNPQVETHLAQTAEILRSEVDYLESMTQIHLAEVITADQLQLNRRQLSKLHLAIQRRIMRHFLQNNLPKSPNFAQIENLIQLINAPNKTRTSTLSGNMIAEVEGDWIKIVKV
jgi:tRNA(Ile)-lysidine synthase